MHRHCGTNNRAPRWTFTDPCKPEVRPGAREESASPAWLAGTLCENSYFNLLVERTNFELRLGVQKSERLLSAKHAFAQTDNFILYSSIWLHSFCGLWEGWVTFNRFYHTSWMAVAISTDRTNFVRNRCVIEVFGGVFVGSLCFFWIFFSVGIGFLPYVRVRSLPFFSCLPVVVWRPPWACKGRG